MANVNYADYGFVRVAAVAPELALADPETNAERLAAHLRTLAQDLRKSDPSAADRALAKASPAARAALRRSR